MKYFKSPNPDNLYSQYRELAKKYHPDNITTGNIDKFRDVKTEYDYWKQKFRVENIDIHMVARQYAELIDNCLRILGINEISYNLRGVDVEVITYESTPDELLRVTAALYRELPEIYPEHVQLYTKLNGHVYAVAHTIYGFMVGKAVKDLYPKLPAVSSTVISKNNWVALSRGKWTQWMDADSGMRGLYSIPHEDAVKNLPRKKVQAK